MGRRLQRLPQNTMLGTVETIDRDSSHWKSTTTLRPITRGVSDVALSMVKLQYAKKTHSFSCVTGTIQDFLSWDSHWTWCQGDSGYHTSAREVNRVNRQHQDNSFFLHQVGHVFSWNDENHMICCIIFIKFEKTLHIWQPYFTNKSYPTWHLLTPQFTDVTTELVLINWRSKAGDGPGTAWGACRRPKNPWKEIAPGSK